MLVDGIHWGLCPAGPLAFQGTSRCTDGPIRLQLPCISRHYHYVCVDPQASPKLLGYEWGIENFLAPHTSSPSHVAQGTQSPAVVSVPGGGVHFHPQPVRLVYL